MNRIPKQTTDNGCAESPTTNNSNQAGIQFAKMRTLGTRELDISKIISGLFDCRIESSRDISDLTNSLKSGGQYKTILGYENEEGLIEIVAGHRINLATKEAGNKKIEVTLIEKPENLSDLFPLTHDLETLSKPLNSFERARFYYKWFKQVKEESPGVSKRIFAFKTKVPEKRMSKYLYIGEAAEDNDFPVHDINTICKRFKCGALIFAECHNFKKIKTELKNFSEGIIKDEKAKKEKKYKKDKSLSVDELRKIVKKGNGETESKPVDKKGASDGRDNKPFIVSDVSLISEQYIENDLGSFSFNPNTKTLELKIFISSKNKPSPDDLDEVYDWFTKLRENAEKLIKTQQSAVA